MNKVYIALYGVGLGHASRMLLVANKLAQFADIKFSSFGDAVNYINMHGFECFNVPAVEFAWSADSGFSIKNSISRLPKNFINFVTQCNDEIKNIASFNPNMILSDTRLSSLLMAKWLGLPCVTIINQIRLLLSPRLREVIFALGFERALAEFLGILWSKSDAMLIPDLPPPYTLSEQNLWSVASVTNKLNYVGFMAPKPSVSEEYVDKVAKLLGFDRSMPIVFAHISGPTETKMHVLNTAIEGLKKINDKVQFVVSEGKPKGDTVPRRMRGGWYFEWCPVRDEIFAMSNLLILRGGHSSLAQAIQYGKPVVTIPIENHGEQTGNCGKAQKMGLGLMMRQRGLKPEDLSNAVLQVLNDSRFANQAKMLMDFANKLDGIENIVQIVRSYF